MHIVTLINRLQREIEKAAARGEISEEEYEVAFHAAATIESFFNREEWADLEDPLHDLALVLSRLQEGR